MSEREITIYGTFWCPDCRRAKKFLGEQMIPYRWVDIEQDEAARALVEQANHGRRIVPTILFPDQSVLVEPTNAELARKLGLETQARCEFYDVVIVGGGVAGLTAALYLAREGFETLIVEQSGVGGQAAITEKVENYPGFPEGISGAELSRRFAEQAVKFGVEIMQAQEISRLQIRDPYRIAVTREERPYNARVILIATGAQYRRLNVRGEDEYIGAGIHFCATCDGPFYRGAEELMVIGGGNSAVEEALFLTRFAQHVTLVVRGDHLNASKTAQDKLAVSPQVQVRYETAVQEFRGNGKLNAVRLRNNRTGQVEERRPAGVFVFIGQRPNSDFVEGLLDLDDKGFILTGHDLEHSIHNPTTHPDRPERHPFSMETSVPGIFAAGDVRAGATAQIASAAGEGASVAIAIKEYLRT